MLLIAVTSVSLLAYGANEGENKVEGTYSKAKSSELYVVDSTDDKSLDDEINNSIPSSIASVLGYDTEESEEYYLIFGEELSEHGMVIKTTDKNETEKYNKNMQCITTVDIKDLDVVDMSNSVVLKDLPEPEPEPEPEPKPEPKKKASRPVRKATITNVDQSNALLHTDTPDANYKGAVVTLDPADRDLLEHLVMGEAGNQGFEGAALVAQAIRDSIVYRGYGSVAAVRSGCGYSGSISREPNDDVKRAVAFIFDEGGIAVKHKIFYFYAFTWSTSKWHETQKFIIQHGGHRFFSTWN